MNEACEVTKNELAEQKLAVSRHLFISALDLWEALRAAVKARTTARCLTLVHPEDVREAMRRLAVHTMPDKSGITERRRLGCFSTRGACRPVAALPAGVTRKVSPSELLKMIRKYTRMKEGERITHFAIEVDGRITYRIEKELN